MITQEIFYIKLFNRIDIVKISNKIITYIFYFNIYILYTNKIYYNVIKYVFLNVLLSKIFRRKYGSLDRFIEIKTTLA